MDIDRFISDQLSPDMVNKLIEKELTGGVSKGISKQDLAFINQYRQKIFNRFNKEVCYDDKFLDVIDASINIVTSQLPFTEDELFSYGSANVFPKYARNLIEDIAQTLILEYKPILEEKTRPGNETILLETKNGKYVSSDSPYVDANVFKLSNIQSQKMFIYKHLPVKKYMEGYKGLKATIKRRVKKHKNFKAEDLYEHMPEYMVMIIQQGISSGMQHEMDMLCFLIICHLLRENKLNLPLNNGIALNLCEKFYTNLWDEFLGALKKEPMDVVQMHNKQILLAVQILYANYQHLHVTIQNLGECRAIVKSFNKNLAFIPVLGKISPVFAHNFHKALARLSVRDCLLPRQGVCYRTLILSVNQKEGDGLSEILCGERVFYFNEFITESDRLILVMRCEYVEQGFQSVDIYEPAQELMLYTGISASDFMRNDKKEASESNGLVVYNYVYLDLMLGIYEKILNYFSKGDAASKGSSGREPKELPKSYVYDEIRHIHGTSRRLPRGFNASAEARQAASAIGLRLQENETYVRPHDRTVHRGTFGAREVIEPIDMTDLL